MKKKIFASLATVIIICSTGISTGLVHADVTSDAPKTVMESTS